MLNGELWAHFIYVVLILREQLHFQSHRCHQCGRRVPASDRNSICCWVPTFKSCFVSLRSITFFGDFVFLTETICVVFGAVLYLVQFLEELSISPERGGKDLNNFLWCGVESCKEVGFHAFCSKETYGNRVSPESLNIASALIDISGS